MLLGLEMWESQTVHPCSCGGSSLPPLVLAQNHSKDLDCMEMVGILSVELI